MGQLIIVPNKYPRELGLGAFHPHTLGEGWRPWFESVMNSPIGSCIVSRSLPSIPGTQTTGRTVRPETIKLLEENIGKTLFDMNHSRILYDPPPRILEIKAKINKCDLMELQSFCTTKETISR